MTKLGAEAYRLHVLGTRELSAPDGSRVSSVLAQPKRLCLLTYLALAPGPVSRSTLAALFWPESDESRARNALSQALHYLRRSLGDDVLVSVEGDGVASRADRLWCDARVLLHDRDVPAAVVAAAARELLEGWNADDSQPLQEWLDATRRAVRARREALLEAVRAPGALPAAAAAPASPGTGVGADPPGAPRREAPARGRRTGGRWAPRRAAAALAATSAVVSVLVIARIARPSPAGGGETVVVIAPRVVAGDGSVADLRDAIHDELVARLHRPDAFRVVSAAYFASIDELRRQMAALDELDRPTWVVYVTAVVVDEEARVHGFLYHNPSFEVAGAEAFEIGRGGGRSALLELPPEIARRVGAMVERELADRDGR